MAVTKVLVVDDSITMRALFTNALERHKDIVVVGAADGADEARQMIETLLPDVITLDVEMPGKNGLEFLAELMETRPTRVVMLSTLTQKGADTTLKAIELGAIDCFPKPARATPDEFDKVSASLCKVVLNAAKSNLAARLRPSAAAAPAAPSNYSWDGSLIAIAGNVGSIDAARELLGNLPKNCPPTVVCLAIEESLVASLATSLAKSIEPVVAVAEDGAPLVQGTVYVAANPEFHVVVDRWPEGTVRLIAREPVNGCRPSADLLFATIAKIAGPQGTCIILSGAGADGSAGLAAARNVGALCLAQDPETALVREGIDAASSKGVVSAYAAPAGLAATALSRQPLAVAA